MNQNDTPFQQPNPPEEAPVQPLPLDEKAERRQIAWPALALAFIFLATLLFQELIVFLVRRFAPDWLGHGWFVITVSSLPMYLLAMPLSFFLFRLSKSEPPKPQKLGALTFFGLIPVCFALSYVGSFIGVTVNTLIGILTGTPPQNDLQLLLSDSPFWAVLLFTGILAPVMEEIFFRKMVIDRLRRYGDLPAVLISGIVFGLLHGNFHQFFYAAMIGIVFGWIYLRTGRLRYTISLHVLFNMLGGVFISEVAKAIDPAIVNPLHNLIPILLMMGYLLFIGLCFIATPIVLIFLWKHIRFQKAKAPLSAAQWCRIALLNPAVWLLLAVVAMLFLL